MQSDRINGASHRSSRRTGWTSRAAASRCHEHKRSDKNDPRARLPPHASVDVSAKRMVANLSATRVNRTGDGWKVTGAAVHGTPRTGKGYAC